MINFKEINDPKAPEFEEFSKIYIESFPPQERPDLETIAHRLTDRISRLFVGKIGDRVVSIALLYALKNPNFVLLDFIGTDSQYRSQGLGTQMMNHLGETLKSRQIHLIIEVEDPQYSSNFKQGERRIAFYRRLGAKILENVPYLLAPFAGETPTKMKLMIWPDYGQPCLSGALLTELIYDIYQNLYDRDRDDPFLNSFINDIPETIQLT